MPLETYIRKLYCETQFIFKIDMHSTGKDFMYRLLTGLDVNNQHDNYYFIDRRMAQLSYNGIY